MEVARLLGAMRAGEEGARERLFALLYDHLRHLAAVHMQQESADHTLGPTSLVHDSYLRLCRSGFDCADRLAFLRIASAVMRRVLIDSARRRDARRAAHERSGEELAGAEASALRRGGDYLRLEEALVRLSQRDPELMQIVELRFFVGLGVEEAAEVLGVSAPTIKRGWRTAKAWLHRDLTSSRTAG